MHSILPPSSAARRVACPASRQMEEPFKNQNDSEEAKEGEAAHWLAAWSLKSYNLGEPVLPSKAPNGLKITQEMIEGAELYQSHVYSISNSFLKLRVEQKVDICCIYPGCFGTPDCWHVDDDMETLHIWDYKYGHKHVEVFENWQLIEYSAGILDSFKNTKKPMNVVFYIVQPRSYHKDGTIRSWSISVDNLKSYFDVLRETEQLAMSRNPPFKPSDQCVYCLAKAECPALEQNIKRQMFQFHHSSNSSSINNDEIGNELKTLKDFKELLEARLIGLEELAISKLKKGERVNNFRLEASKGAFKWNKDIEEIKQLGELFDIHLTKSEFLITPLQAIKEGIPESIINRYSERTKGNLKLVLDINHKKIFGGNQ